MADADRRWFTVPDTGVHVLTGSVTVKAGATQTAGDGVIIYLYRRTSSGAVSVATVREIVQQANDYQIVSASTVTHLEAGDSIAVAVYLEAGVPSPTYTVQAGEWEGVFSAWLVAPAPTFTAPPTPFASAGDWRDGEQITPALMQSRITNPIKALYNPPRVSARSAQAFSVPSGQTTRVGWSLAGLEESGGWRLSQDAKAFTVPASGVYLTAFCLAIQRDGPTGAFGSYQMNLMRNGNLISLHQRQNTRTNYPAGLSGTDVLFLAQGDTLSIEVLGTGTGLTWQGFGSDIRDERWSCFGAVMLAPGASSMKG
ncbi:hypothetical protein FGW37_05430 [Streptomyces rectiverticillatus]|uniref:hypothetical protein n=1 Tax=Streptomyces rectiverticillatus TaxID=173860 RepID=UPI0015C3823F|nr:hypothetical protein [Streptomyces rectiverticillatus]QLE71118.1 hypothetical protein FGW37_05430 [Streptomyces rectiverticillatus]